MSVTLAWRFHYAAGKMASFAWHALAPLTYSVVIQPGAATPYSMYTLQQAAAALS
jgi:hypothetical protein